MPIESALAPTLEAMRAEAPSAELVAPDLPSECLLANELRRYFSWRE